MVDTANKGMFLNLMREGSDNTLTGIKYWYSKIAKEIRRRERLESETSISDDDDDESDETSGEEEEEVKEKEKEKEAEEEKEVAEKEKEKDEEEQEIDLYWARGRLRTTGYGWCLRTTGGIYPYYERLVCIDGPHILKAQCSGPKRHQRQLLLFIKLLAFARSDGLCRAKPVLELMPKFYNYDLVMKKKERQINIARHVWKSLSSEEKMRSFGHLVTRLTGKFLIVADERYQAICEKKKAGIIGQGVSEREYATQVLRDQVAISMEWNDVFQAEVKRWWNTSSAEERLKERYRVVWPEADISGRQAFHAYWLQFDRSDKIRYTYWVRRHLGCP